MSDFIEFGVVTDFQRRGMEQSSRQRQRHIDSDRESLKDHLKHMSDEAEKAQDYLRRLIAEGADVSDELSELSQAGVALQLITGTMQMAIERKRAETPLFWTQDAAE